MIIDARTIPNGASLAANVCVVGGGPAGITLALEFVGQANADVILLESGGLHADPLTQSLYAGEVVGQDLGRPDENRNRFLGGSSNCWGGWCKPLDPWDFEARPWVPHSGWPIGRAELDPFYERAHRKLQLGPYRYEPAFWEETLLRSEALGLFPLDPAADPLVNVIDQFSPPTRFGQAYREELKRAAAIRLLLYANAVEIQTDGTARHVERVEVATLEGGRFSVAAQFFVLAAGGIDNPRLLLASNHVQQHGLGNGYDLVGRYFADHPRVRTGRVRLVGDHLHRRLYDATLALTRRTLGLQHLTIGCHVSPSRAAQFRDRLLNSRHFLVARPHGALMATYKTLADLRRLLVGRHRTGIGTVAIAREMLRRLPAILPRLPEVALTVLDSTVSVRGFRRHYALESIFEPAPNRDSRVTLGLARDRLGMPVTRIDWRLSAQDRDNFLATVRMVRGALTRTGIVIDTDGGPGDLEAVWPDQVTWCWHHMGTTRMHPDPRQGVVDARCRVHGVSNLFVAGSSVFPTMGNDMPTLTIVALALRLADHLKAAAPR